MLCISMLQFVYFTDLVTCNTIVDATMDQYCTIRQNAMWYHQNCQPQVAWLKSLKKKNVSTAKHFFLILVNAIKLPASALQLKCATLKVRIKNCWLYAPHLDGVRSTSRLLKCIKNRAAKIMMIAADTAYC